jgi:hypothetical protein
MASDEPIEVTEELSAAEENQVINEVSKGVSRCALN